MRGKYNVYTHLLSGVRGKVRDGPQRIDYCYLTLCSVALFCMATLIELSAEPAFIFCQANLFVGARVLVEGRAAGGDGVLLCSITTELAK